MRTYLAQMEFKIKVNGIRAIYQSTRFLKSSLKIKSYTS